MADSLANYTLLDNGFELIDNYVHVKWFDGEQVPQGAEDDDDTFMKQSDNEYVEEEDEVTGDEGSEDGDNDGDEISHFLHIFCSFSNILVVNSKH